MPPDEKMPTPRPDFRLRESPRVARHRAAPPVVKSWESMSARRSRDEAIVMLHPELADLPNPKGEMHKHAREITLEHMTSLVRNVADVETQALLGSTIMPERRSQQFGESHDGQAGFPTPRFNRPVTIPPRQTTQANTDGILPPDSARHDGRNAMDRYYSVRQTFAVRRPQPPLKRQVGQKTPLGTIKVSTEEGKKDRDEFDVEYKDFGAQPTLPEDFTRKGVQKSIRSKLHWGRFEQIGRQQFLDRDRPNMVAVAHSRHANPDKDYNTLIKEEVKQENYNVQKIHKIAEVAEKVKVRRQSVREKRASLTEEYELWRYSVAEKFDSELQKARAIAEELVRRQRMWLSIKEKSASVQTFANIFELGRLKRKNKREEILACVSIQSFVRFKIKMRRLKELHEYYAEIIKKMKPFAYMMVVKWRARL